MATLANAISADLYRKVAEVRRNAVALVVGNIIVAAGAVWLNSALFAVGGGTSHSATLTICWFCLVGVSCAIATDIAKSRRDATIVQYLGPSFYRSLLTSAVSRTLADFVVGTLPAVAIIVAVATAMGHGPTWREGLVALWTGVLVGLAIGPVTWSLALYLRGADWVSAGTSIVFFAWIGLANYSGSNSLLYWIAVLSPAALAVTGRGWVVWGAFWMVMLVVLTALGALLSSFVRSGGDLVVD